MAIEVLLSSRLSYIYIMQVYMPAHGSYIATHAEVAKADAYCIDNI